MLPKKKKVMRRDLSPILAGTRTKRAMQKAPMSNLRKIQKRKVLIGTSMSVGP
jgi:hypothetical protein